MYTSTKCPGQLASNSSDAKGELRTGANVPSVYTNGLVSLRMYRSCNALSREEAVVKMGNESERG